MSRNLQNPFQTDLFHKPVFHSPNRIEHLDMDRFRSRIKRSMSASLNGLNREAIAQTISAMPGIGTLSKVMLDAYTSEAKNNDISLVRFKALIRATGNVSLWDDVISDEGLIILQGDEARLAEISRLEQEKKALANKLKELRAVPVEIKRGSS